jgi:hypothetical protein
MSPDPTALKYPLHHAIKDKACSEQALIRILKSAYEQNPESIGMANDRGLRPITVAIVAENLTAINTLLELAAKKMAAGEDPLGLQLPDKEHETALSYNVRLLRQCPRFLIHDLLDGASRDISKAYIKHKMPPCTCEKCTHRWLSPKMRFRLRGESCLAYSFNETHTLLEQKLLMTYTSLCSHALTSS